jgi:hypothetical protein
VAESFDFVWGAFHHQIAALTGQLAVLRVQRQSHPLGAAPRAGDAEVYPPGSVVVPDVMIGAIALVRVQWDNGVLGFFAHIPARLPQAPSPVNMTL